jgi:hypothetical protein
LAADSRRTRETVRSHRAVSQLGVSAVAAVGAAWVLTQASDPQLLSFWA